MPSHLYALTGKSPMANRGKYCQAQAASPPTAWTKILKAKDLSSPDSRNSLVALVGMYDQPLQVLFMAIVPEDNEKALDWKQDFVMSHLLTGKVFQAAKPGKRFRTFLSVCVRISLQISANMMLPSNASRIMQCHPLKSGEIALRLKRRHLLVR